MAFCDWLIPVRLMDLILYVYLRSNDRGLIKAYRAGVLPEMKERSDRRHGR